MRIEQWLARALVLMVMGVAGCPAVLDDNFTAAPDGARAGETSTGGLGASAGPNGGAPDSGAPTSGGNTAAGKGSTAGSESGGADLGGDPELGGAAGNAEGGAPPAKPCAECVKAACCDGECVDLALDAKNCRTCGNGCPGTTCVDSSCTNNCAQGFIECNQNIADGCEINAAVDPENCGNCHISCDKKVCVGGNCVCPANTGDCDGFKDNGCEVDVSSDAANCGGCLKPCSASQRCVDGVCGCEVGFADCNLKPEDGCEASLADDHSCGSCSLDCGDHGECVAAGSCGCENGFLDCDDLVLGCETPKDDPNHCGSCSKACASPTPACDGVNCTTGCGDLTKCGASCVDTAVNLLNCGGCGKPVGSNQTCVAGKPKCIAGYDNCDSDPTDCEVNTDTDAAHCGGCATPCKSGALCTGGSCACAPTTPNDCGTSCEQCCSDGQCSDGDSCTTDICDGGVCGSGLPCDGGPALCCSGTGCFACCGDGDCALGKVCSGNQCVNLTCPAPQIVCNNKCVNPTNDPNNCSTCDKACGLSRTCSTSACTPSWVAMADPPSGFVAREKSAYTAMGSKVFIWGGVDAATRYLATGAVYDPDTDTWATVAATGTPPTARVSATAVWTGSVVVVWGGGNATADLTTGGRYDPVSNSWQAISTTGAPAGRRGSYGFWTGSRVLIWGGVNVDGDPTAAGALYDPVNDKWTAMSNYAALLPRNDALVTWTGSQLLVYGGDYGSADSLKTYTYTVSSNAWATVADGPSARDGALGTWDGSYLPAWSGQAPLKADGKIYEPTANKWTNMGTFSQPEPRWAPNRKTGWSARLKPGVTLILGGMGASSATFFTDGGIYNSTTNAWTLVPSWPTPSSHIYGVGVWSGSEFVLWGGHTGTNAALTASGGRFRP